MTDQTERYDTLDALPLVRRQPRDPLKRWLQADALFVFASTGMWALWTHREWLREIDTVIAVLAVVYFIGSLLDRDE